jgi:class 3 adenylate cyclase
MSAPEIEQELSLEIAHLLLIDIVGYSRLLVNEQIETLRQLNTIVRSCDCFRAAETAGKLIRLPTGDGMALLFFGNPEQPVRCAIEITQLLKQHPQIQLRMGIHSGPVNQVRDVNDALNVAGTGINIAQRVMDCGDAGHILLSKHVADDLAQYRKWHPYLHDLGECEVKHGLRLNIVNFCRDGVGNPQVPSKLRSSRWRRRDSSGIRAVRPTRFPAVAVATVSVLSIAVLALALWLLLRHSAPLMVAPIPTVAADKSIAVLPFANLTEG